MQMPTDPMAEYLPKKLRKLSNPQTDLPRIAKDLH